MEISRGARPRQRAQPPDQVTFILDIRLSLQALKFEMGGDSADADA